MSDVMGGELDYAIVASLVESGFDAESLLAILLRTYNKGSLGRIADPVLAVLRYRLRGETEEDRLQTVLVSAMKGIVRAIRKFDYRLEVPFAGYASRWSKNFVARAIRKLGPDSKTG